MLRRAHIIRGEMFVTCLKILYVPINIRRRKNNLGLHLDQRLHIPGLDHGQSILQSSRCHLRLLLSRRCTFLVSFGISTIFVSLKVTSRSSLLFSALTAMAEIPALYAQRPIVLRHQQAAMYHPFVETLALTLVDIPITVVTLSIFSIVLYFMVGFQLSAVRIDLHLSLFF
jgi:hypothetical protein